jgi:hypothetical protein
MVGSTGQSASPSVVLIHQWEPKAAESSRYIPQAKSSELRTASSNGVRDFRQYHRWFVGGPVQRLMLESTARVFWQEVEDPPPPPPGAALVRPVAVATCDLDVGVLRGRFPLPGALSVRTRRSRRGRRNWRGRDDGRARRPSRGALPDFVWRLWAVPTRTYWQLLIAPSTLDLRSRWHGRARMGGIPRRCHRRAPR